MVASIINSNLTPLSWLKTTVPDDRESYALPVANGEPCFAIMLYTPPKRSKWRPRLPDALPPLHIGKRMIWFPSRVLANVVRDCREYNERQLLRLKPGKKVGSWAVPVSIVCGFDETAKPIGGAI